MPLDYEVFEEALTLFHHYSLQNSETVAQLQARKLLPETATPGFHVLDIGAGQGYLPSLLAPKVDQLVLVEPNPRCVAILQAQFETVYPLPWNTFAFKRIQQEYAEGFDLITMSHMLYHFAGLDDIRQKIKLALTLLKPGGHLAIILNTPAAPMARIGIGFQIAEGRSQEALVNQEIHSSCHHLDFYKTLSTEVDQTELYPIETPLLNVSSFSDLVKLFRMCLINPLSESPCEVNKLDAFITRYLQDAYPDLAFPATLPSQDELIILRKQRVTALSKLG